MKKLLLKKILPIFCPLLVLFGCSTADKAFLNPVATYTDGIPEGVSPVHLVAQKYDEYGNKLPAYLSINKNGHREVFLYPAPTSSISVYCERIVDGSRQTGYGSFQQKLELGKTYNVYCNEIGNNRYKVVAKDADSVPIEKEPTNLNRVKFFTGKRDPLTPWLIQGTQMTGVRNWDGKVTNNVELTGPRRNIVVFCRPPYLSFPVEGDFKVGKTYQVTCLKKSNSDGIPEVEIKEIP